ncbi:MAG TPA: response regulator [Candidatus Sulfotelmatobacter sp.]
MARILLIEDNRDHLELMAYLLRAHGDTPLSAGSAECGFSMLRCCQEIDLIVCDINLGNANGLDLIRAVRKAGVFPGIPIIAVTAGSSGQALEAFEAGVNRYILKPIEPETFAAEIALCLAGGGRSNPASAPKPQPPSPAVEPPANPPHATILAVDDRSTNLDLIAALLKPLGYCVLVAHGVAEALSIARRVDPDLVLTDVHMGDGSGFELIRAMQQDASLQHIPWLVTSATYLKLDARAEAICLDDSKFILQPWEPSAFIAKIADHVQKKTLTERQGRRGQSGPRGKQSPETSPAGGRAYGAHPDH